MPDAETASPGMLDRQWYRFPNRSAAQRVEDLARRYWEHFAPSLLRTRIRSSTFTRQSLFMSPAMRGL